MVMDFSQGLTQPLGGIDDARTMQPGTLARLDDIIPTVTRTDKSRPGVLTRAESSDKYAVLQFLIDNAKAYQILPADPMRKLAWIKVPGVIGGGLVVNPANPAPATNLSLNISPHNPFTVINAQYVISTSAVVANRQPQLLLAGTSYVVGNANVAASQVNTNIWTPGGALANGVTATGPIPNGIIYPPGTLIATNMLNMQAGDQISAISFAINQSNGVGIVIGPEPVVDGGAGYPINQGDAPQQFTGSSALFAIALSSSPVTINVLVEKFGGEALVN